MNAAHFMFIKQGTRMLRKAFNLLLVITALLGAGALLAVVLLGYAVYKLSDAEWKWSIPPQDCGGSTFSVKGFVFSEQGDPIHGANIHAFNRGSYELAPFDVTVVSDKLGYFETQKLSSFACTEFEVEISAIGFGTQKFTYYPPGEQWPDELPVTLTITLTKNESIQDSINN